MLGCLRAVAAQLREGTQACLAAAATTLVQRAVAHSVGAQLLYQRHHVRLGGGRVVFVLEVVSVNVVAYPHHRAV